MAADGLRTSTIKEDMENMSMSTLANEEVEMQTLENKKRLEEEFYEYFSFGKYLELH